MGQIKHGMSETRLYQVWKAMRQRCSNPAQKDYRLYGGRGIQVCERWNEFSNFLADMSPRPAGMMLDRIDCDGNYEPSNCRWATPSEQRINQRPMNRKGMGGTKPIYSQELISEIIADWKQGGWSCPRLARKYGVSQEWVRLKVRQSEAA